MELYLEDSRDTLSEMQDKKPKDSPKFSRVIKRSSSLDDPPGETWKFFTDIKGRITKTVEEKIEEIKSDRYRCIFIFLFFFKTPQLPPSTVENP